MTTEPQSVFVSSVRKGLPWIGTVVGMFLLLFLVRKFNLETAVTALKRANFWYVIPEVMLALLGYSLRLWRWKIILLSRKDIAVRDLAGPMASGFAINNIFFARIGDVLRAYLVARDQRLPVSLVLGTVLFEKIADTLTLLLFLFVGALAVPELSVVQSHLGTIFAVVALVIAVLVLAARFSGVLMVWSMNVPHVGRWLAHILRQLQHFLSAFHAATDVRRLATIVVLSCAAWCAHTAALSCLLVGFHISLPYAGVAFLLSATVLGLAVPTAPAGLGAFQAVAVYVLQLFRVPSNTAFGFALAWNAVEVAIVTLPGLIFLWRRGLSLRNLGGITPVRLLDGEESVASPADCQRVGV